MKKTIFFLFIIASFTFFFMKYQSPEQSTQILHLNMKAEPKTMDPRKGGDWYSSQMHSLFFEGLV
ncbi:MAG: hypothetical protein AABZ92_03845, partial [Verrucomicrobiota bacterium]